MQTRSQRSTVLGKRDAPGEPSSPSATCDSSDSRQLLTPDSSPNPKRLRTSATLCDGDWNKENIPPLKIEAINASPSSRATRLRRTSTVSEAHLTPRSGRLLRRYNSMSTLSMEPRTPVSAAPEISLATPPSTPSSTLLPISARARALLRATCNNTGGLSGRVDEAAIVQYFIRSFITPANGDAEHTVLYISGSPGTGKTALVNAVLNGLESELAAASTEVVSVNCMALNNVDALWGRLVEVLGAKVDAIKLTKKAKQSSLHTLEKILKDERSKCIVLLDELDHVASSTSSLSTLFNLVHQHASCIRVIGIANTHTLTASSTSTSSKQALAHVKTCHFAPYTPQQLLDILRKRLSPLSNSVSLDRSESQEKFLPPPTLMLLTKKIAAQTGDVRALFEVLRGAIDIAMVSDTSSSNPLASPTPAVTPSHIIAALKAYSPASTTSRPSPAATTSPINNEFVAKVHGLGLQARLVLLALMLACRRVGLGLLVSVSLPRTPATPSKLSLKRASSHAPLKHDTVVSGVDANQLHVYYMGVLSRSESEIFAPVSRSEFNDLLGVLETVGLVALNSSFGGPSTPTKSGRRGLSRTSSFATNTGKTSSQMVTLAEGIRLEEVSRGLGLDAQTASGDVRSDEVRAIADRERARMAKEARVENGLGQVPAFEGAAEN